MIFQSRASRRPISGIRLVTSSIDNITYLFQNVKLNASRGLPNKCSSSGSITIWAVLFLRNLTRLAKRLHLRMQKIFLQESDKFSGKILPEILKYSISGFALKRHIKSELNSFFRERHFFKKLFKIRIKNNLKNERVPIWSHMN